MASTAMRRALVIGWAGVCMGIGSHGARGQDAAAAAPYVLAPRAPLALAGAEAAIAAAKVKAREMGLAVNIAVVDDGGHPIAFARMDGARPGSAYTAQTKAGSAAVMRQPSGPIGGVEIAKPADVWLNLSLQQTAAVSGGKVTTLRGGVPIVVDGQVIGAVGVGGATGDQDALIAAAGVEALLGLLAR